MSWRERVAAEDAATVNAYRAGRASRSRGGMQAALQGAILETVDGIGLSGTISVLKQELQALGERQADLDRLAPEVDTRPRHRGQIKLL